MITTASNLIKLNVSHVVHENDLYFNVSEIKLHYPYLRFPAESLKKVLMDGTTKVAIRPQDMEEMTEFEINVVKFMSFNPKDLKK